LSEQFKLPDELRTKLAKPMGRLFTKAEIDGGEFGAAVRATKFIVSVGDRVTETLAEMSRPPDVQIVDSKENRKSRRPPKADHSELIRVKNPAGYITIEAINGIKRAFFGKLPSRVLVDGEEDLLAIPAIVLAPISSGIFYGQPGEGIVMVLASREAKARNRELLAELGVPPVD
jgi:GTP-dependent dephospho-CoA kinase